MLEVKAHEKLKQLLSQGSYPWPHYLTFSRLVSRSLRRKDQTFIHLDTASKDEWWLGLMVPLCLQPCSAAILLSERNRGRLLNFELPRLRSHGLNLNCSNSPDPPSGDNLWTLDFSGFLNAYQFGYLKGKQLIIPDVEFFKDQIRDEMSIKITNHDWQILFLQNSSSRKDLVSLYENLTRSIFSRAAKGIRQVCLKKDEINLIIYTLQLLSLENKKWQKLQVIKHEEWVFWVEIDYQTLAWELHIRPMEPFDILSKLFIDQPMILISQFPQNVIDSIGLPNQLASSFICLDFYDRELLEPLPLFSPKMQPLPNTEIYYDYLLDQCRRLILGRPGITVILLDDTQTRLQLTSTLAAEFGSRVVHETTDLLINGVLTCQWSWWLQNHHYISLPDQLIIALLPFKSLESPLTAARVRSYKKNGLDWFRGFLLPEALFCLAAGVIPLRQNNGRLAILDGRLRYRSWGKEVLKILEPWIVVDRLLPDPRL